jgi:hypothetical protein
MAKDKTEDIPRNQNLRCIRSGEVRNPTGRNGKARLEEFREFLSGKAEPTSSRTRWENVVLALYTTAIDRRRRDHVAAVRVVLSYDLGQPPQTVDLSNSDGSLRPLPYAPFDQATLDYIQEHDGALPQGMTQEEFVGRSQATFGAAILPKK